MLVAADKLEAVGTVVSSASTELSAQIEPVSYTHLDVYKRQRLLFWILKFAGTNVKKLSFFIAFTCTCLLYTSRCV